MEFLKNLFTNDNSIIGLCGIEEEDGLTGNLNRIFTENTYPPPVNLIYRNQKHLANIFST